MSTVHMKFTGALATLLAISSAFPNSVYADQNQCLNAFQNVLNESKAVQKTLIDGFAREDRKSKTARTQRETASEVVRDLRDLQNKIDKSFQRGIPISREQNMSLQGSVKGSIDGSSVEYSPLSMFILGMLPGLAAGGAGLLAGTSNALVSLGAASALGGGIFGATTPTGHGELTGKLNGSIHAEGYQIHEKPNFVGFAVIDPVYLERLNRQIKEGGKTLSYGCPNNYTQALNAILKDRRGVLTTPEASALMNHIQEYQMKLNRLRDLQSASFRDRDLASTLDRFQQWIEPLRVHLVHVGADEPIAHVGARKTVLVSKRLMSPGEAKVCEDHFDCTFVKSDSPNQIYGQIRFEMAPDYTEEQFKKEFDRPLPYAIANLAKRSDGVFTSDLLPLEPSDFKWTRYDEGDVRLPSEPQSSCKNSYKSPEEAAKFLAHVSRSYDLYLAHPSDAYDFLAGSDPNRSIALSCHSDLTQSQVATGSKALAGEVPTDSAKKGSSAALRRN